MKEEWREFYERRVERNTGPDSAMRMGLGRFFLWLAGIDSRLVRVKSFGFRIGPYGVEGPTMLVDTKDGGRETIAPVWDAARLRAILWGRW